MALVRHYHLSMDEVLALRGWEFNALVEDMNDEAQESKGSPRRPGHPPGSTPVIT